MNKVTERNQDGESTDGEEDPPDTECQEKDNSPTEYPPIEERLRRMREPLDYSPSSGAVGSKEKIYDTRAPDTHDDRSKTVTTFNAHSYNSPFPRKIGADDDDPRFNSPKERWQWLRKLNDGVREEDRSIENDIENRKSDVERLASILNLTDYQCNRANHILQMAKEDRERGLFFGPNRPVEVSILAALTLAASEDGRLLRVNSDTFEDLCANYISNDVDRPRQQINSVRKSLEEYT